MHKIMILASVSSVAVAAAFMSDTQETVVAGGVRYDKDVYEAMDKSKRPALDKDAETAGQDESLAGFTPPSLGEGVPMPPAPSAPHFGNVVAPDVPSHDSITIKKEGSGKSAKYFVVYPDGSHIENFRDVDKAGYATEGEAWAAVMTAKRNWNEQTVSPPPGMPSADEAADKAAEAAKA